MSADSSAELSTLLRRRTWRMVAAPLHLRACSSIAVAIRCADPPLQYLLLHQRCIVRCCWLCVLLYWLFLILCRFLSGECEHKHAWVFNRKQSQHALMHIKKESRSWFVRCDDQPHALSSLQSNPLAMPDGTFILKSPNYRQFMRVDIVFPQRLRSQQTDGGRGRE